MNELRLQHHYLSSQMTPPKARTEVHGNKGNYYMVHVSLHYRVSLKGYLLLAMLAMEVSASPA